MLKIMVSHSDTTEHFELGTVISIEKPVVLFNNDQPIILSSDIVTVMLMMGLGHHLEKL